MLLHKDREQFEAILNAVSDELKVPVSIVEKDYYVTMILKQLAMRTEGCVFKGGTSLSKCHHAIDRFSEDIDISFSGMSSVKSGIASCMISFLSLAVNLQSI